MKQGKDRFVALPRSTKDLIVMYRKEHGLSYRDIEKRLDVSRETARLVCIDEIPEEAQKAQARKKKRKNKKVVTNSVTVRTKKPKPQYRSVREYDFLQYIRIVYKWALSNHPNLNRGKLELLLYLYPKGAFSYSQFHKYHKTVTLFQNKTLADFIEHDYVYVWRQAKDGSNKLYALTKKAKNLCDMMHKYCVGDEILPTDESNALVVDKKTRINNYYLDMIKDMNKRKKVED